MDDAESGPQDLTAKYAGVLRPLVKNLPGTQADFARKVFISESHLSLILHGKRLPSPRDATAIAAQFPDVTELADLYAEARGLELEALPTVLIDLLDAIGQVCSELPYLLPSRRHLSLSTLYVKQNVSSPVEVRWPREELPAELGWVEGTQLASTLAQPFSDVFEQHDHLVIEGGAGLGKTTLARQLVASLAAQARDPRTQPVADPLIPVLLSARVLAKHIDKPSWGQTLLASITEEYPGFSDRELRAPQLTQEISGYGWLVVIDALDEVPDATSRDLLITQVARRMGQSTNSTRFLITTRPLEVGETTRLTGASFFELQPFDAQALKRFAHNWFDADNTQAGAIAAEHFLEQVRTAGLTDILEVPLLAAIAANVHQSAPDSPLPASRYELYERYITSFAEVRAGANAQILAVLAGQDELAWRIDAERMSLLEHLASSYMTSEIPLLEVARDYLADKQLLPARRVPKWEDSLAEWLCQDGLLTRSGQRLRFLHQTFAEHLAASAQAKTLPTVFNATDPVWDELIRGMSLGNENDNRVILHYLHLGADGDAVIAALQDGTLAQRKCAGELINQGAPCGDRRIRAYLSALGNEAFGGEADEISTRLKELGGLIGRPIVRSWLVSLLREEDVPARLKITIVDLLRDHSPEVWREGVSLLSRYTSESWSTSHRREAARVLAKFGEEAHHTATKVLMSMTEPSLNIVTDRIEAARLLAEFGDTQRQIAARVLATVAIESGANPYERRTAAHELAKLGGDHLEQGAVLLQDMVVSPILSIPARVHAATALVEVSRQHREPAAAALVKLVDNPATGLGDRLAVIEEIPTIDPRRHDWAAKQLLRLANDPTLYPWQRVPGASVLGRLGKAHRSSAAEILADIAQDHGIDSYWRLDAVEALTRLGRTYQSRSIEILGSLAQDPTAEYQSRLSAVEALAKLGVAAYPVALAALRGLLDDPTIGSKGWAHAGRIMANMGNEHRTDVVRLCDAHLDDSVVSADWQVHAAILAGNIAPTSEALARAVLVRLGRSVAVTSDTKWGIIDELMRTGDRAHATELLAELCADPTVSNKERRRAAEALPISPGCWREVRESTLRLLASDPTADAYDYWAAIYSLSTHQPDLRRALAEEYRWLLDVPRLRVNLARVTLFVQGDRSAVAESLHWRLADPYHGWQFGISFFDRFLPLIVGLGEQESLRALRILRTVSRDTGFPTEHRLMVIRALMEVNVEERAAALATLRDMITDSLATHRDRLAAWSALARAGEEWHSDAAGLWHGLVANLTTGVKERVEIAEAAMLLGGEHRQAALGELDQIARDSAVHSEHRLAALKHLSEDGPERHEAIATALLELATDSAAPPRSRLRACQQLCRLGSTRVHDAVELARGLALDPTAQPSWCLAVADVLDDWEGVSLRGRIDTLHAVAGDREADPTLRYQAAQRLARLGPEPRRLAVKALRDIADDAHANEWSRLWASEQLTVLDQDARSAGLTVLARLAHDETVEPIPKIFAQVELVCADETRIWETHSELTGMVSDSTLSGQVRLEAVEGLFRIAPPDRRATSRLLHGLAKDDCLQGWERRLAALRLASVDLIHRANAVAALNHIAGGKSCEVWERIDAAVSVAELDASHREAMLSLVQQFAEGEEISPAERRYAATALLNASRFHHGAAKSVLRSLATNEDNDLNERRLAAKLLAVPGRERAEGVDLLRMMTSKQFSSLDRVLAWEVLSGLDCRYLDRALSAVEAIAKDEAAGVSARRRACTFLFKEPAEPRDLAIKVLSEFVSDASVDDHDRMLANGLLANDWFADRNRAGAALEVLAVEANTSRQIEAVELLDRLDPQHRATSRRVLVDMLDDATKSLRAWECLTGMTGGIRVVSDLRAP